MLGLREEPTGRVVVMDGLLAFVLALAFVVAFAIQQSS